jgi:hypothetical protein
VEGSFFADEVAEAVARGAETPDDFSTRPTVELQTILRETPTLPLATLLNHGGVEIDYAKRRIWRDSFWKGSFAKDTLLGWEERLRGAALGSATERTVARYAGGSFWKRFDQLQDHQLTGHVVNYELDFLPGKPLVRPVTYPDSNRKYFKAGDEVLLLTYTNEPYRIVYDVIKAIDQKNCIGVMHLGEFPHGLEFATFVMARHNYPFENMSVPDHQAIFHGDHVRVPSSAEIAGAWQGHLIFLTRPDVSLLNQFNPVAFQVRFVPTSTGVEARFRFGLISRQQQVELTDEFVRLIDSTHFQDEIRMIDRETMIGQWRNRSSGALSLLSLQTSPLQQALRGYLAPVQDQFAFYYLLTRVHG